MSRPCRLERAGAGGDLERGLGPDVAHAVGNSHGELLPAAAIGPVRAV